MSRKSIIMWCLALTTHQNITLPDNAEIDLRLYEKRLISKYGEDGILQKIFSVIETPSGYYVEVQAGSGHYQSMTKYLKKKHGWKGLLLDRTYDNPALNLHKEAINPDNVCDILKKYNVPHEFDLMVISNTQMEFYVWNALSASYKPKVVVISFNQDFNYNDDVVRPYGSSLNQQSPDASILALYVLGRNLGYSLVYQESTANYLFFIRDDVLRATQVTFKNTNAVSTLYTGTPKNIR
jgi:hypothetical protein